MQPGQWDASLMPDTFWHDDSGFILSDDGAAILCDECPCDEAGGGIDTPCCPNPVAETLYATLSSTGCSGLDGVTVTMNYIGPYNWTGTFTCDSVTWNATIVCTGGVWEFNLFDDDLDCLDETINFDDESCDPFLMEGSISATTGEPCGTCCPDTTPVTIDVTVTD